MSRFIMTLVLCSLSFVGLALNPAPAHAMRYKGVVLKAGGGFMFSGAQYSFTGAELLNGDTQIGAVAGVSTLWKWSRKSVWMLVLEADYVQKGYSGSRQLPDVDTALTDIDVLSEYISVPILGRVHFIEDQLSVFAVFGPSMEFRISHDDDALLDEGKDFALAANVGVGFEYEVGDQVALQLDFRYATDITDSWNGGDLYTVQNLRYQSFMITGGLRF
jgi:hypothetical protein